MASFVALRHTAYFVCTILCILISSSCSADNSSTKLAYKVLYTLPHNTSYFTQGLVYEKPFLYESTGLYKQSKLIKYQLNKNHSKVLQVKKLSDDIFAEGLTLDGENLVLLSYKKGKAWVYDKDNLRYIKEYSYQGEGWGLTAGLGKFYMSNGSNKLMLRNKSNFSLLHQTPVLWNKRPLKNLNELEWVKGNIAANIWYDKRIVFINPFSGQVKAYIDLAELIHEYGIQVSGGKVTNGIAYDAENNILYVTGKLWPKIFALSIDFDKVEHFN